MIKKAPKKTVSLPAIIEAAVSLERTRARSKITPVTEDFNQESLVALARKVNEIIDRLNA